ncbi:MAG TPA: PhoH family protein [Mariprofundaceae bacterium]|nr:PhoH family protein [Mariprofundaceae bacterium]
MNPESTTLSLHLDALDADALQRLCGPGNQIVRRIEDFFAVKLIGQPGRWVIEGRCAAAAATAMQRLAEKVLRNEQLRTSHPGIEAELDNMTVESVLRDLNQDDKHADTEKGAETLIAGRRHITGKTKNQRKYLRAIQSSTLTLAVGPAGSGKTYLAVAAAVAALNSNRAERIILTRPAVEAGERLGFLPGDLQQKVDPYLRPLFDALADMLGIDKMNALIEQGRIEIAPLAYMRGRTLNDAFVILDEAQNTTREQMKMFLTRLGFGSTMVVTGDITQVDLPNHRPSGLLHALQVLEHVKDISLCRLNSSDVVRHRLVESIVNAYEEQSGHD